MEPLDGSHFNTILVGGSSGSTGLVAATPRLIAYVKNAYLKSRRLVGTGAASHGCRLANETGFADRERMRRVFLCAYGTTCWISERSAAAAASGSSGSFSADSRSAAERARAHGILAMVDGTYSTPVLQRTLELGADLVVPSATKYLGVHSDLLAVLGRHDLMECMRYRARYAAGGG